MQVIDAIRAKRAVREFLAQAIPEADVHLILNAGRRAQSAENAQPWRFIAVRSRPTLQALSRMGTWAGHLAGAALGVVIVTPDPAESWSILFDAGQAAAYMQLAAWERGIGSCPATLYELEAARSLLGFPSDWVAHVALSFGYPANAAELTRLPKPGGRKDIAESASFETWEGQA